MSRENLVMIQETVSPPDSEIKILTEANSSANVQRSGGLKFKAILQEADVPNQNKRIYHKKALQEGIELATPKINKGIYFCEMDHPRTEDPGRFMSVLLKETSHRVLSLEWNGNILEAVCQTTSNDHGKNLRALIEEDKINVGFSLRAVGKTKANPQLGLTEVVGNMRLVCWDSVADPSHANALTQHILESTDIKNMLVSESKKVQMLSESLGYESPLELVTEENSGKLKYDHKSNMVIMCHNGACMKTFLEDYLHDEFKRSFANLLKG